MTKLGKILVVFTAAVSVAFLAFVGVTAIGGPNWEARAKEIEGYGFNKNVSETGTTYTVTKNVTTEDKRTLVTAPSLPAAVVAAQKDRLTVQGERLQDLDGQIEEARGTLETERKAQTQDEAGVPRRIAALRAQIEQLDTDILELTKRGTQQAEAAGADRATAEARQHDVARLAAELAQVRTDRYQILEQQRQLEDLLVRLEGSIDRAERRRRQLATRTDEYDPAP